MSAALDLQKERNFRLQAELYENGISLGSYVTEGEDKLIIGSSKRADLVVPHESVSQIHAMLRVLPGKDILLYDLGSEKGTFVEGKKIVERKLQPGEIFEIGSHQVKVNLIDHGSDEMGNERAMFWKSGCEGNPDNLEFIFMESGLVRDEKTLAKNGRIYFGRRKNEILLAGGKVGERFLQRKDSGKSHNLECYLPEGYRAEIFDGNNDLVRVEEKENTLFSINEKEKAKLVNQDETKEILLFWRTQGVRSARTTKDADNPVLQRVMLLSAVAAGLLLAILSYVPLKKETVEEAVVPKTSYYRLSMDSAPAAPQAASSAESEPAQTQASNNNQKPAASKVANISSSLSKLLNKKSSLTADNIQQAISNNGAQTTRMNNLKNANLKSENIAAGSIGGGSVNVNAISAGLSNGAGKGTGSLKGFAGGKGASIGSIGGSGFGGKGFDMSLGGDEAEAIGGLDKALIAAVVQSNIGQIKHCYERQLIVNPNIFGKIVANWTINKDGKVNSSNVKKTTMNNSAVENCIMGKIKNWTFPKPKGGGQVIVSYPFLFKSLN